MVLCMDVSVELVVVVSCLLPQYFSLNESKKWWHVKTKNQGHKIWFKLWKDQGFSLFKTAPVALRKSIHFYYKGEGLSFADSKQLILPFMV